MAREYRFRTPIMASWSRWNPTPVDNEVLGLPGVEIEYRGGQEKPARNKLRLDARIPAHIGFVRHTDARVYLNGEPVTGAIVADEAEGLVVLRSKETKWAPVELRGEVEIRFPFPRPDGLRADLPEFPNMGPGLPPEGDERQFIGYDRGGNPWVLTWGDGKSPVRRAVGWLGIGFGYRMPNGHLPEARMMVEENAGFILWHEAVDPRHPGALLWGAGAGPPLGIFRDAEERDHGEANTAGDRGEAASDAEGAGADSPAVREREDSAEPEREAGGGADGAGAGGDPGAREG